MAVRETLSRAFRDAYGVFSVQNPMISGVEGEIQQGRNVADAARECGVRHLVYGSAGTGQRGTGIGSWESKLAVQDHMHGLGLPLTGLRPVACPAVQVITAADPRWIGPFTGLTPRVFRRLVTRVERRGGRAVADGVRRRQWSLPLADRVLLVAAYYRTNLTMRQLAPLFGIKTAAVHRIVDRLGPYLALAPARRRYEPDTVLIVDGTLVPTRDRTIAASSKNYRYSASMQVPIDASTRLVVAVGQPQPGNRRPGRNATTPPAAEYGPASNTPSPP